MKAYIGTKIVQAEPMNALDFEVKFKGEPKPDGNPISLEGYHVRYPDGYDSWCPKETFEAANREISQDERNLIA